MPAEYVHLSIATRVADVFELDPTLRPEFALGSVAADVINVVERPRQDTHFWYWPEGGDVSGAPTLLALHPELAARHLSPPERAFVAGYLSHLITDEQEIVGLYRPYVARFSTGGAGSHNREVRLASLIVVDAAVEASDPMQVREGIGALRAATHLPLRDNLLPFVTMADVRDWAACTLAVADLPASRPRVEPHLADRQPAVEAMQRIAVLEQEVGHAVPGTAIRDFIDGAVGESVRFLEAYLADQPLPTPQGTTPYKSSRR
jgi:hypothetical protein